MIFRPHDPTRPSPRRLICATDIPVGQLVGAVRDAPDSHVLTASPQEQLAVSATIAAEPVDPLPVSVPDSGRPATRVRSPVPSSL